jgi:hypothetical protein
MSDESVSSCYDTAVQLQSTTYTCTITASALFEIYNYVLVQEVYCTAPLSAAEDSACLAHSGVPLSTHQQ